MAGVVGDHLHAERVVGVGVIVRRQRHGDHGGVRQLAAAQRRPHQADGREGRGAVADQRQQDDRTEAPSAASWVSVTASATGTNVRPAYLSLASAGVR